jgi:hypothetical protein
MVIWLLALACDGGSSGDDSSPATTPDDSGSATGDDSGGDDSGDDSGGNGFEFSDLAGACDNGTRIGAVEISHTSYDFPLVFAEVLDAPLPTSKLTLLESKNGCSMMRKENPFCDPTCGPGETCSLEGECVPYPLRVGLGTLAITGTNVDVTLEAQGDMTYWDSGATLPLFTPGAPITATTTGSKDVPAFELHGFGVDALVLEKEKWLITEGEDLEIRWTPSTNPNQIWVSLAIDQHGITPVTLYCEVEDTGSLTVPSVFVDTLVQYGVSGFPAAYIYRRTVDSVTTPLGCIELAVAEQEGPLLAVEGHTPCFGDQDCPEGQHCEVALQTCYDDE